MMSTLLGTVSVAQGEVGMSVAKAVLHALCALSMVVSLGYSRSATATDTTAPTTPANLAATAASPTQINLTWSASTDSGGSGLAGYKVERCQGSTCTTYAQITSVSTASFSDSGLSPATTYRYRVRAYDNAGNNGAYSTVKNATTQADSSAPTMPGSLAATASSTTAIGLTWSASTDNIGVTGYKIERCQGGSCTTFAQITTTTALSYNDTGRAASTTYRYRVRAYDAASNNSGYSNIASATTLTPPDTQAPSTPSGFSGTAISPSQINLSWTASTDPGGSGVAGYKIERCQELGCTDYSQIFVTTATSFGDSGLFPNTNYRYRVRAYDNAGNQGAYSSVRTVITQWDNEAPSAPGTPVTSSPSQSQIDISWAPATDNDLIREYRVESCQGAGCTSFVELARNITGTAYSHTGLTASTIYQYRVYAVDRQGNAGDYSAVTSQVTQDPPESVPPSAPGGVSAAAISSTQVSLSWTSATDNVGVTGYFIERCNGLNCTTFTQVGSSAATTYIDAGASPSTIVSYRVRATDAVGNLGPYSGTAVATTWPSGDGGTYEYYANGRLHSVITATGVSIIYTYDAAGHLISIQRAP
jgi:YD repeat-containing protein